MLEKEKSAILTHALRLAPFEGWNEAMLAHAVKSAGFEPVMEYRAFPGGVVELVDYFCQEMNRQMEEALAVAGLPDMRIRDRIKTAVLTRLELYTPHKEAIRRLQGYFMLPMHVPQAMRVLYQTVSAMWYAAGDNSTDFNFYTKRTLLAGVYSSTLLYWLNDDSYACEDTKAFLDRRIDDVMQIQRAKGKLKEIFPFAAV